jgi:hypothetical protein
MFFPGFLSLFDFTSSNIFHEVIPLLNPKDFLFLFFCTVIFSLKKKKNSSTSLHIRADLASSPVSSSGPASKQELHKARRPPPFSPRSPTANKRSLQSP